MLPPGHIAAGFLTAEALLHFTHPELSPLQQNQMLWWGMFFGFAPDLDYFWIFFREQAFTIKNSQKNNHRRLISHAPILWLIAGLLIYFLSRSAYIQTVGLLVWLASWSHLILDSVEDGIMWLWPLSKKQFALSFPPNIIVQDRRFFRHWWSFFQQYLKRLTFYLEVLTILTALIIYFK
ncbi:MAG: metal-dependent hydrolase [Candidatus Doudnabacteria bacterium]|nr:metal-dependent hydrolase [Candidatus Doudnabacteria bacterium]